MEVNWSAYVPGPLPSGYQLHRELWVPEPVWTWGRRQKYPFPAHAKNRNLITQTVA